MTGRDGFWLYTWNWVHIILGLQRKRLTVQFSKEEDLKSWLLDHVLDKKRGSLQPMEVIDR